MSVLQLLPYPLPAGQQCLPILCLIQCEPPLAFVTLQHLTTFRKRRKVLQKLSTRSATACIAQENLVMGTPVFLQNWNHEALLRPSSYWSRSGAN